MHQMLIDVLLALAIVNKNNLYTSCSTMLNYFKDVTNLFLHAAAELPKHCAKDQDTLIKQSFIHIYQAN